MSTFTSMASSIAATAVSTVGGLASSLLNLTQANRIIRMQLSATAPAAAQALIPYQLEGEETVCGGLRYRMQCVGTDFSMPLKTLQGLAVAATLRSDLGIDKVVAGIVARAKSVLSDNGATVFEIELRDPLHFLGLTRTWHVYTEMSVLDITEEIFKRHTRANNVLGATWKLNTDGLSRDYPKRAFTLQAGESDRAFYERLWRQEGIAWYFVCTLEAGMPVVTLMLADSIAAYHDNPAGTVSFHRANATETRDTITAWSGWRQQSVGNIERASFNYKTVGNTSDNEPTLFEQGKAGDALAATLEDYDYDPAQFGASQDHYGRAGRKRIEAHEFAAKGFQGSGTVRLFAAGSVFTLANESEIDTHRADERRFILTRVTLQASNGIPLSDTIAARLSAGWSTSSTSAGTTTDTAQTPVYRNQFECVRASVLIVPTYDPHCVPQVGLLSAMVVGDSGKEIDVDSMGRIAVRFLFAREADHPTAGASDSTNDSARIRVMHPWADAGYGTAFWPRVGSEILVGFIQNHPDKPIALGGVYDGTHGAPQFSGKAGLPGNSALYGIRSRELKGQGYNQLRFDDTSAQIATQLASTHGAAQLNLGYLSTPRDDGRANARGEGFEIATDAAGALRSARGMLLSAFARNDAGGKQLSREETLELMEECVSLFKQLGDYAEQHEGKAFDTESQLKIQTQLTHWENGSNTAPSGSDGGAPLIALSAPDGLVLNTRKSVLTQAAFNVDTVALKNIQSASTGDTILNAGKGINLFAQSADVTVLANQGKVVIQSQANDTVINSAKNLKLSASDERIQLMAAKEIILVESGGAYIKLAGGNIELGGPGAFIVKAASHTWAGAASAATDLPKFDMGDVGRTPILVRPSDGQPIEGASYQITRADGSIATGLTDTSGKASKISDQAFEQISVNFFPPKS